MRRENSCLRRTRKPEHTRRKHLDGRRENGYLWGEANDEKNCRLA